MFAFRGIAVSLTFFVLIYCFLSALVAVSWRCLRRLQAAEQSLADLLFLLRVLPLLVSIMITAAFVVPSFQILEPRSTDEGMGTTAARPWNCRAPVDRLWLLSRDCRAEADFAHRGAHGWKEPAPWSTGAQRLPFARGRETPPLTLVGMRKPRVLVSDSTLAVAEPGRTAALR